MISENSARHTFSVVMSNGSALNNATLTLSSFNNNRNRVKGPLCNAIFAIASAILQSSMKSISFINKIEVYSSLFSNYVGKP